MADTNVRSVMIRFLRTFSSVAGAISWPVGDVDIIGSEITVVGYVGGRTVMSPMSSSIHCWAVLFTVCSCLDNGTTERSWCKININKRSFDLQTSCFSYHCSSGIQNYSNDVYTRVRGSFKIISNLSIH